MPNRRMTVHPRLHPSDENVVYTISNTIVPRSKVRSKVTPRQAYISKWDASDWRVIKTRKVSDGGVTCFDMRWELAPVRLVYRSC